MKFGPKSGVASQMGDRKEDNLLYAYKQIAIVAKLQVFN